MRRFPSISRGKRGHQITCRREDAGEGGDEFATGAEGLPGPEETSPPEAELDAEPAAESYKVERDLPLILENKGIELPNLDEMTNRTNLDIDKISKVHNYLENLEHVGKVLRRRMDGSFSQR